MNYENDIYELMRGRGLTSSARHWSRAWLGRAANYACVNQGRITAEVALGLVRRLIGAGQRDLADYILRRVLVAHGILRTEVSR